MSNQASVRHQARNRDVNGACGLQPFISPQSPSNLTPDGSDTPRPCKDRDPTELKDRAYREHHAGDSGPSEARDAR